MPSPPQPTLLLQQTDYGTKTVLIVDDEPDILELLAYNLRKESFTVLQAQNGKGSCRYGCGTCRM